MTAADLAAHTVDWVEPVSHAYRGIRLHEIPPNGQGIAALMALAILEHFDLSALAPDSPESVHLQIEAMKLAFADLHQHVADPRFMHVPPPICSTPATSRSAPSASTASVRRISATVCRRARGRCTSPPPTRTA